LIANWKTKDSEQNDSKHSPDFNSLFIFHERNCKQVICNKSLFLLQHDSGVGRVLLMRHVTHLTCRMRPTSQFLHLPLKHNVILIPVISLRNITDVLVNSSMFYVEQCNLCSYLQSDWQISLMKQQFAVTHTICQSEIPALLDSWVTNTPSVKILHPQKIAIPYIFVKTWRA
jgi:hypothetical protein